MPQPELVIRTATPDDVATMLEWAADEGWNPGTHDLAAFLAADPGGFLIGSLGNEPVACISVVKYGDDFGFLGMYIARPAWRGQGHGIALWRAGMARMQGRTVGLDGVVAQQANYAKSGFVLAYSHFRYEGRGTGHGATDVRIVPVAELGLDALAAYDRQMFPQARRAFLEAWVTRQGVTALALAGQDGPAGYGVIRPSRTGYRIGPLFADAPEGAALLLDALRASVPEGAAVFIDVPLANAAAVALVEGLAMQAAFETARMYAGPAPQLPVGRIYGVTSLELG